MFNLSIFPLLTTGHKKNPSGAGRHIETFLQGALCEHTKKIASRKRNISPLLLQLPARGNTRHIKLEDPT